MRSVFFVILFVFATLATLGSIQASVGGNLQTQAETEAAPTVNFVSVVMDMLSLRLNFSSEGNPSSLVIERGLSPQGPWDVLTTLASNETSYWDSNIRAGVTYFYRIKAIRDEEIILSRMRNGYIHVPTLKIEGFNEYNETISMWGKCNGSYFSYVFQRRQLPDGDWLTLSPAYQGSNALRDSNTLRETTYQYRIKALPESITDQISNVVTHTTLPKAPPPSSPSQITLDPLTDSSIYLRWVGVPLETGYLIERRLASEPDWTPINTVDADVGSYVDTTVIPGQSYYYRITAFNEAGYGIPGDGILVKAQVFSVVMEDDFEVYMSGKWVDYMEARNIEVGGNGTNILWFASWRREVTTVPLDVSGGGKIEFSLRAGNSERDGSTYWDNSEAEAGRVVLEYKVQDSQEWTSILVYNIVYPNFSDWATCSVNIPFYARTTKTQFRWRQVLDPFFSYSPEQRDLDTWALDNVKIYGAKDESLKITKQPIPVVAAVDQNPSAPSPLSVGVNKSFLTYQWFKDGQLVPGATNPSYIPNLVRPQHAGNYDCVISDGFSVVRSRTVLMGVIERTYSSSLVAFGGSYFLPLKDSFTLGLQIYPAELRSGLSFLWYLNGKNLTIPAGIGNVTGGGDSPSMTVAQVNMQASGDYVCKVYHLETRISMDMQYRVSVSSVPIIGLIPETTVVAGYDVSIPANVYGEVSTIRVYGLPTGLRFDAETRRIVGTVKTAGIYKLSMDAWNANGSSNQMKFELNVVPYPESLVGTYRGVFNHGEEGLLSHGGQIAFQISKKALVSGTVTLRGKVHRFISSTPVYPDGRLGGMEASFKDKEGKEYLMQVELSGDIHEALLRRKVGSELHPVAEGFVVRNPWSAAEPAPNAGWVNAALSADEVPADVDSAVPEGTGFLNLNVSPRGTVMVKGRLADGQAVMGSTVLGPNGVMPVFVNLYKGSGGLTANVTYQYGEVSGVSGWSKDAQGAKVKDRTYKAGFVTHYLTIEGGKYVRPAVNAPLLPFPTKAPLTKLTLNGGGLGEVLTQSVPFNTKHQAVLPRDLVANPYGVTLKMNPGTGVFTGSFKLVDENPASPNKPLRRMVTYQGCLIPGVDKGVGFFLLPELPTPNVQGSTLKNTPIRSGKVDLSLDQER